jgi:hypothetical protein
MIPTHADFKYLFIGKFIFAIKIHICENLRHLRAPDTKVIWSAGI